jgi:hypothetical protein
MSSRSYEPEEIQHASGETIGSPDPESAYFLGPTSESDFVYAFTHKLDALVFVKQYFDKQLTKTNQADIDAQIELIRRSASDSATATLTDLLASNDGLDIYAEGYWEEFVETSSNFWEQWVENATVIRPDPRFWNDDPDDDLDNDDLIDDRDAEDADGFLFSEPPEDVFNPEFVDAMMNIIPMD